MLEQAERFFITWVESDKAEMIEDILDDHQVAIEMLPTPTCIRDQVDYIMVCKDAFEVKGNRSDIHSLSRLGFPAETRCFDEYGTFLWEGKQ